MVGTFPAASSSTVGAEQTLPILVVPRAQAWEMHKECAAASDVDCASRVVVCHAVLAVTLQNLGG